MRKIASIILFSSVILCFSSIESYAFFGIYKNYNPICKKYDFNCKRKAPKMTKEEAEKYINKTKSIQVEKKKEARELEDVVVVTSSEEIEKIKSKQKKILGIFDNPYANANPKCKKYDFRCKRKAPKVYVVETNPEKMLEFGVKENTQFKFFTGMFDFSDHKQRAVTIGLEHQDENLFRKSFLGKISPITGGWLTANNSFYFYSGMQAEYDLGFASFTPSFAPGYYNQGKGKDLGHVMEFKTEVQLEVDVLENSNLAFSYNHISNASLGTKNPGANSYMFNFLKNF
jgi:lipid A 3-O-deacylase